MTLEEIASLVPADRAQRRKQAEDRMYEAGAHFAINSIADLPAVLTTIESRLAEGHQP
jgi:phosphonoacetaldehyde hydrolase